MDKRNSVIHLQAHIFCEIGLDQNNSFNHTFFFFRDTTNCGHAAASSRNVGISMATRTYYEANDDSTPQIARYDYFESSINIPNHIQSAIRIALLTRLLSTEHW